MNSELAPDAEIHVDLSLFALPVILRAAYAFTDAAYIWLRREGEDAVVVMIARKRQTDAPRDLEGAFHNALIDFAVRARVFDETRVIRETIFKAALGGGSK